MQFARLPRKQLTSLWFFSCFLGRLAFQRRAACERLLCRFQMPCAFRHSPAQPAAPNQKQNAFFLLYHCFKSPLFFHCRSCRCHSLSKRPFRRRPRANSAGRVGECQRQASLPMAVPSRIRNSRFTIHELTLSLSRRRGAVPPVAAMQTRCRVFGSRCSGRLDCQSLSIFLRPLPLRVYTCTASVARENALPSLRPLQHMHRKRRKRCSPLRFSLRVFRGRSHLLAQRAATSPPSALAAASNNELFRDLTKKIKPPDRTSGGQP